MDNRAIPGSTHTYAGAGCCSSSSLAAITQRVRVVPQKKREGELQRAVLQFLPSALILPLCRQSPG
jgi:hypothetical protein